MLIDFFTKYPEFANHEFFISGESYAGIYIPALAYEILQRNTNAEIVINLKGLLIGNGVTEPESDSVYNSLAPFYRGHSVISSETAHKISDGCNGGATPNDPRCLSGLSEMAVSASGLNRYQIYTDCKDTPNFEKYDQMLQWDRVQIQGEIPCVDSTQMNNYFNRPDVQAAFHVRDIDWVICSDTLSYSTTYGYNSFQFYPELLEHYRIWAFFGTSDAAVPYNGGELWTKKLGYPLARAWRRWDVESQVAGHVVEYATSVDAAGLAYVTVLGGWHTVPESHPVESLYMLQKFLAGQTL
eukprot:TRINITY_DN2128_c0_g1_i3.p1 TRINITY_DN2128_c0_g1~~TRINITY_DN2128_c0_g1_i3.p1  ORF type:complete len:298 (+),score=54.68 TRINITY_DN2128_c0_g1_i3:596-1489(+)